MPIQPFINPYITELQVQTIVDILIYQCNLIEQRNNTNHAQFPELEDAEYMRGRGHGDTGAVYAGFQPNTAIPGMTITKLPYGRGLCLPQLESETIVLQIYGDGASLNIDEIKNKCATYNIENSNKKFCVIQFRTSSRGHLTGVDLIQFDNASNIVAKETIYTFRARILRPVIPA